MPDFQAISGEVRHTTDDALLVYFESAGEEVWVPRSVTDGGDALDKGDTDLSIATWWLRTHDLEDAD